MHLLGCGINHKSAGISVREQISFDGSTAKVALKQLIEQKAANEAVLLSTCNRTEIYATTHNPTLLKQWFIDQYQGLDDLNSYCYDYFGQDCVHHLMRVASGLDSMVLGEPQILGQIKQAYRLACDEGMVGHELKQLFPAVFAASKQIRHYSQIGKHPVSIAYAIVQLGKRIFSKLNQCQILLIGAGEEIELLTTHLIHHGINHFIIANRSIDKAKRFNQGQVISLSEIPLHLQFTDLVVSATSSPLPLIGKGMVESALKQRKHKPILMIDLAVPRDIEPEVAKLEDIYLYNIDDLQEIINNNWQNKVLAAEQAEIMIQTHTENFMRQHRIHRARKVIKQFRDQAHTLREQEIKRALLALNNGHPPETVLNDLTRKLTNKILHQPTIKLRQAASDQQEDILFLIQALLKT